jgi:hypothetical protein
MKKKFKILIITAGAALAVSILPAVFHARPPVLIVADSSFIRLYGESRMRRENFHSSLKLFRPVKTVAAADDSGDDIVQFAIAEISSRPFCVLFPFRFAGAARLYHDQNPLIHVVLLEGMYLENYKADDFNGIFVYKTDIEADFYKVAAATALIEEYKNGKIAVFVDTQLQKQCREAFLQAFSGLEMPPELLFFTSFSQYSEISGLSCVVLAGTGSEYLENFSGVPVIFITWIDPSMMPDDVVLVVDDSPWVQVPQAVGMALSGSANGLIKSNFLILNEKKIGSKALRKMKKIG